MLLHDIGKSPNSTLNKINKHLQANYGFKISEDVADKDLVAIMEQITDEIRELKIGGNTAKASPEISKRLLILEGLKTLREYTLMQFQSPKLDMVIKNLVDFVVDTVEITAMQGEPEFEKAMERAMDEYRSSRYRFPDDVIEHRVRAEAMGQIMAGQDIETVEDQLVSAPVVEDDISDESHIDAELNGIEENDTFSSIGKRSGGTGGYAAEVPDTQQARHALRVLDNPKLSLAPKDDDQIPMIRGKDGRMVPDPFAAHAAERRKGIVMKEQHNLVKNLRKLLETEVSQAEVMMAAKGFAQELQEMVEKIGRLQNEDLPPVTDQMRETYGTDSASAFQTQIYGALQGVMDSLYTAKSQVDDAVTNMATTGQYTAQTDMDKDIDMDNLGGIDSTSAMDADLDNLAADELNDEFGSADEAEPLGRSMKAESLQQRVMEMKRLLEKAKKLKEAKA